MSHGGVMAAAAPAPRVRRCLAVRPVWTHAACGPGRVGRVGEAGDRCRVDPVQPIEGPAVHGPKQSESSAASGG